MAATGKAAALRAYFESGATLSYSFRRSQLLLLRSVLIANETEISAALYSDLKKSEEETYATETGFVIAEINAAIKQLGGWMEPEMVPTNLVNFPSRSTILHDPLGVVLIIAPWNYPLQLLLNPLVGAIAAGNCMMLKPSELAPATASCIEKMMAATFDPRYISVVQGDGASILPALIGNFNFDHIFYTGSTAVGRSIYQLAAKDMVPVTLELGGKSPCVIEFDANLKVAAKRIVLGKFINAGQTCVAPDYLLVHSSVKEKLLDYMTAAIAHFYTDNPVSSGDYGKIINEKRFDRLVELLADQTIYSGGKQDRSRLYIEPTILVNVVVSAAIMQEEIFGPILPVLEFTEMNDALSIIRQHPNPLAFYLFTGSANRENLWMRSVRFGGGCVNNTAWQLTNHHLPFGGVGNSGIGNYHGQFSFKVFSHAKAVLKTPTWIDPYIKYPPFKGRLKLFKWLFR